MGVEDGRKKGEGGGTETGGEKKNMYIAGAACAASLSVGATNFFPSLSRSPSPSLFLSPPAARIFVGDLYNTIVRPACVDSCAEGIYVGSYRKINCRVALDPRQKKVETGIPGAASRSRLEDE